MSTPDTSHPAGFPFVYHEFVSRIRGHSQNLFLIQAGTGMGKTGVLKELAKSRGEEESFVRGRLGARAVTHLTELAGLDLPPEEAEAMEPMDLYCIDDLDAILGAHRQPDRSQIDQTEDAISVLKQWAEEGETLVVATTTALPHRLIAGSHDVFWSKILQNFKQEFLDPWPSGWKELRRDELEAHFGNDLPDEVLELWCRQVLEMSGGHPTLFGICFGELRRLINLKLSSREAAATERGLELLEEADRAETSGPHPLEDRLRLHLEDLLHRRALPTVTRALRRLQKSSEWTDQKSFEYLKELAEHHGTNFQENPEPFIRHVLYASGLAHLRFGTPPDEDSFEISGEFIRQEIRRMPTDDDASASQPNTDTAAPNEPVADSNPIAVPPASRPQCPVTILSDDPEDRNGWVVATLGDRRQEVSLSPSMWKALRLLEDHAGKTVTLNDLQSHLDLSSHRAARSTLERLKKKLKDHQIFDMVESVWGRGYRLGSKPYWKAD